MKRNDFKIKKEFLSEECGVDESEVYNSFVTSNSEINYNIKKLEIEYLKLKLLYVEEPNDKNYDNFMISFKLWKDELYKLVSE